MSKLLEFRAAEVELGKQLAALEALRNDLELKRELEFDAALTRLLKDYNISRETLVGILGLKPSVGAPKATSGRGGNMKRETPKTFINPHTNESLTIKRMTNLVYKEWVKQYGEVTVQTWLQ